MPSRVRLKKVYLLGERWRGTGKKVKHQLGTETCWFSMRVSGKEIAPRKNSGKKILQERSAKGKKKGL